jgi:hypothetical protein
VTIANIGTTDAATIGLTAAGPCSQEPSPTVSDLCSKIRVTITSGPTAVFTGTAEQLGHTKAGQLAMPHAPAANGDVEFSITATLDTAAGNDYMGLEAHLPVRWTLAA